MKFNFPYFSSAIVVLSLTMIGCDNSSVQKTADFAKEVIDDEKVNQAIDVLTANAGNCDSSETEQAILAHIVKEFNENNHEKNIQSLFESKQIQFALVGARTIDDNVTNKECEALAQFKISNQIIDTLDDFNKKYVGYIKLVDSAREFLEQHLDYKTHEWGIDKLVAGVIDHIIRNNGKLEFAITYKTSVSDDRKYVHINEFFVNSKNGNDVDSDKSRSDMYNILLFSEMAFNHKNDFENEINSQESKLKRYLLEAQAKYIDKKIKYFFENDSKLAQDNLIESVEIESSDKNQLDLNQDFYKKYHTVVKLGIKDPNDGSVLLYLKINIDLNDKKVRMKYDVDNSDEVDNIIERAFGLEKFAYYFNTGVLEADINSMMVLENFEDLLNLKKD
ncbi:hypothetical protein [Conchiformibius kuhniae]|uniref:Lipoprotein n=1 Tax=Conchiformibius kuhniae TaxID=211502 RepID=A0A8T9MVS9_9NEIS|nr:hypothetical protein [Conchiformibius kuhniae]UOP04518.1 hypothetical protein LVJ77_09585 [Conchiformibius kuhniae]